MSQRNSEPPRSERVPPGAIWEDLGSRWPRFGAGSWADDPARRGVGFDEMGHRFVEGRVRVGEWRFWRKEGDLAEECLYDAAGVLNGPYRRFRPDGAVQEEGQFERGRLVGVQTWYRGPPGDREYFPAQNPTVVRATLDWGNGTRAVTRTDYRFYDAAGGEIPESARHARG